MLNQQVVDKIVAILSRAEDFMTAKQLGQLTHRSAKTIYRIVQELNTTAGDVVIESSRGRGYRLNELRYRAFVRKNSNNTELDLPASRQQRIILQLLACSPVPATIEQLYAGAFVGQRVIDRDLAVIRGQLSVWQLSIVNQRQHWSLQGSEVRVRQALMFALLQQLGASKLPQERSWFDADKYHFYSVLYDWSASRLFQKVAPEYVSYLHGCLLVFCLRIGRLQVYTPMYTSDADDALFTKVDQLRQVVKVDSHMGMSTTDFNWLVDMFSGIGWRETQFYGTHNKQAELDMMSRRLAVLFVDRFDFGHDYVNRWQLRPKLYRHMRSLISRLRNQVPLVKMDAEVVELVSMNTLRQVHQITLFAAKTCQPLRGMTSQEEWLIALFFDSTRLSSQRPIRFLLVSDRPTEVNHLFLIELSRLMSQLICERVVRMVELLDPAIDLPTVDVIINFEEPSPHFDQPVVSIRPMLGTNDWLQLKQFMASQSDS